MAEVKQEILEVSEMTAEKVHEMADHIPQVVESLLKVKVGFAAIGLVIGAAASALVTYRITEKRLRQEYAEKTEHEIDEMREHFNKRLVVKEEKPDLTDLAKRTAELNYRTHEAGSDAGDPPVVVGPPGGPVLKPPVPVAPQQRNVFREAEAAQQGQDPRAEVSAYGDIWIWEDELPNRIPDETGTADPYVIHYDEKHEKPEYADATMTWYTDDVLCDEDDRVLTEIDGLVGLANLQKFGHGSGDPNTVIVRNDHLEVVMEINRSQNSYAEEVHGLKHADEEPRRARRATWDD